MTIKSQCTCGALWGEWDEFHAPGCPCYPLKSPSLTDERFRALLDLMMCSDPWPVGRDGVWNERVVKDLLDEESRKRGYADWVGAYHEFGKKEREEGLVPKTPDSVPKFVPEKLPSSGGFGMVRVGSGVVLAQKRYVFFEDYRDLYERYVYERDNNNQSVGLEQAFKILETYGIPRSRAGTVENGINVLAQRYVKETKCLHGQIRDSVLLHQKGGGQWQADYGENHAMASTPGEALARLGAHLMDEEMENRE